MRQSNRRRRGRHPSLFLVLGAVAAFGAAAAGAPPRRAGAGAPTPQAQASAPAPQRWTLVRAVLTYHATDALHPVTGISKAARGQGDCLNGTCSFLAAAPVKSFASGDTNRDLHMLQSVRGGQFPLVTVRTTVAESALHAGPLSAGLQVQLGGQTAHYEVPFHIAQEGSALRLTGTIPAQLSDFNIRPPEFLFIKIQNSIPVDVDLIWQLGQ